MWGMWQCGIGRTPAIAVMHQVQGIMAPCWCLGPGRGVWYGIVFPTVLGGALGRTLTLPVCRAGVGGPATRAFRPAVSGGGGGLRAPLLRPPPPAVSQCWCCAAPAALPAAAVRGGGGGAGILSTTRHHWGWGAGGGIWLGGWGDLAGGLGGLAPLAPIGFDQKIFFGASKNAAPPSQKKSPGWGVIRCNLWVHAFFVGPQAPNLIPIPVGPVPMLSHS